MLVQNAADAVILEERFDRVIGLEQFVQMPVDDPCGRTCEE